MSAREGGCQQTTAAAKAGISVQSGRRIEKGEHQPGKHRPRWRSRPDPLAEVWDSELEPLLSREPKLKPMTLFLYLQKKHPGEYNRSILRTLQRRVRQWQAEKGPAKEVMFPQEHRPGEQGLSDYTQLKQVSISINGKAFAHLLYHYRLAYSGWQYVQIVEGGESFVSLSECLQNALHRCGGVPKEHRSDSLSAAYRNLGGRAEKDLSFSYQKLCEHYRMKPSRNNRGKGHENGSIESPHGHFKRRLRQQLLLRGSTDFASKQQYQALIDEVVASLNHSYEAEFAIEQGFLGALPTHRHPDCEVLSLKVTRNSTITVRCILYTVPSRLVGQQLTIHLHHDRLIGFVGLRQVLTLDRLHLPKDAPRRRGRQIDYRHVAESLRRKPRAILNCQWRDQLLPNEDYRRLWGDLLERFGPDTACRLIVEALYIAATQDKQQAVLDYLQAHFKAESLTLSGLQKHFQIPQPEIRTLDIRQHSLNDYDRLITHDPFQSPHRTDPAAIAQIPPPASHAQAVVGA